MRGKPAARQNTLLATVINPSQFCLPAIIFLLLLLAHIVPCNALVSKASLTLSENLYLMYLLLPGLLGKISQDGSPSSIKRIPNSSCTWYTLHHQAVLEL
jgi:hypothetical protein